jgi:flagellar L-ring protein precursor FlgH
MKPALAITLAMTLALGACSSFREAKISEQFQMNYDEVVPVRVASPDGAIYSRSQAGFFLGDRRAQRVGDVLTVNLVETMQASKSNDAAIDSKGSTAIAPPTGFFGTGLNIPGVRSGALDMTTESKFAGNGAANQSNSISGKVTVVVTRVYENGNLGSRARKCLPSIRVKNMYVSKA